MAHVRGSSTLSGAQTGRLGVVGPVKTLRHGSALPAALFSVMATIAFRLTTWSNPLC
jgi:hypothetical protein